VISNRVAVAASIVKAIQAADAEFLRPLPLFALPGIATGFHG